MSHVTIIGTVTAKPETREELLALLELLSPCLAEIKGIRSVHAQHRRLLD